jgi:transposase
MDVVVSRCAGIDIGKSEVVVCVRVPGSHGERVSEVKTFTAFAGDVERLADWLAESRVRDVVLEATGQYRKPVWDVLGQRGFELMLVNARHGRWRPAERLTSRTRHDRRVVGFGASRRAQRPQLGELRRFGQHRHGDQPVGSEHGCRCCAARPREWLGRRSPE